MRSLSLSTPSVPSFRARIELAVLHLATLASMFMLVLTAQQYLAPQANGPLVLAAIFAPYLTVGGMVMLLPFALHPRARVLRWLLLVVAVIAIIRFAIPMIAFGGAATSNLTATSWNLYLNNVDTEDINRELLKDATHIVSLQELSTVHADAITADAELRALYPTQVLDPDPYGPAGLAILSTYPLVDQGKTFLTPGFTKGPAMIWARLDVGGGETVLVANAHPMPGSLTVHFGIVPVPTGFDATLRDIEIRGARRLVAAMTQPGEAVLLLGDFNITEREAAYSDLTAGLQNAAAIAEPGLALSWRLEPFMARGIPLLRIDYLLSNQRLVPHTVATDCTARGSDHCKLIGAWQLVPRR